MYTFGGVEIFSMDFFLCAHTMFFVYFTYDEMRSRCVHHNVMNCLSPRYRCSRGGEKYYYYWLEHCRIEETYYFDSNLWRDRNGVFGYCLYFFFFNVRPKFYVVDYTTSSVNISFSVLCFNFHIIHVLYTSEHINGLYTTESAYSKQKNCT